MDEITISQAHTSCQDCVFAQYMVGDFQQVGCDFNLIEKYKDSEQLVEAYNENGEFYIVNGRLCYYKRTKEWLEGQDLSESLLDAVIKEQSIPYVCFIGVRPNQNIEDVKTTLNSARQQTYAPVLYNFLLLAPCNPNLVHQVISICMPENIRWNVTKLQDVGITIERAVLDFVSLHAKQYTMYQLGMAGQTINSNLMFNLNAKIIDKDYRFAKLVSGEWIIGNSMAHKNLRESFNKYEEELL
jgi:hypothetical protein